MEKEQYENTVSYKNNCFDNIREYSNLGTLTYSSQSTFNLLVDWCPYFWITKFNQFDKYLIKFSY